MKIIAIILMLFPFSGFSQTQNVVSVDRVFPKMEKAQELEKAIAAHAAKYHTGNWKWRVFDIVSGPDAGGLQIVEGPNSWSTIDSRNDISKEHTEHWAKTIAPLLTDKGTSSFSVYNEELSTIALGEFTNNIIIGHLFIKPGKGDKFKELLKKVKPVWTAGNESIAVYESFASGSPQIAIVSRLKNGLKELEKDYRKPFKERYITVNGPGSYDEYLQIFEDCIDKRWSEMLKLRTDLGSK